MVSYPTIESRLLHVIEACRYPSPTKLMEALGEKPQQWRNWVSRNTLGRAQPKLKAVTGASIDWLMTGEGEPFPDGPVTYAGPVPAGAEAMARIADLERDVVDLLTAMAVSLQRFSETTPAAAQAVEADLRAHLARPGRPSAVLPELLKAIGRASKQSAPAAPGKKPQRSK